MQCLHLLFSFRKATNKMYGPWEFGQAEILTAEPIAPGRSVFELQMPFENLKIHKSTDIDQIPAELIKEQGRTI